MGIEDVGLYISYLLFFIALGATIIMPLIHAIKSPGTMAKSGLSVAALVVVFLIGYAIADDGVTPKQALLGVDSFSSKLIGAGLIMFYITFFIAIIGLIFSEINKAFK